MSDLQIGRVVKLPGGIEATLRYVGPVKGRPGTFAGVELAPALRHRGKNSGDANGVHYFDTAVPNTGLFLSYARLVQLNAVASRRSSSVTSGSKTPSPTGASMISPRSSVISKSSPYRMSKQVNASPLKQPPRHPSSRSASRNASKSALMGISAYQNSSADDLVVSQQKAEIESQKKEIAALSAKNEKFQTELAERNKILQGMESTVNSFEPVLANYDKEIAARDTRFKKYKEGTEKQIKELLEAIDMLGKESSENQQMYAAKFRDLQETVRVKQSLADGTRVASLEQQVAEKERQFQEYKAAKSKEINDLHQFEEQNYKLQLQLDQWKAQGAASPTGMGADPALLQQKDLIIEEKQGLLEQLKKKMKEKDERIREISGKLKAQEQNVKSMETKMKDAQNDLEERDTKLKDINKMLEQIEEVLHEKDEQIKDKLEEIREKDDLLEAKSRLIEEKNNKIEEKTKRVTEMEQLLKDKDAEIQQKEELLKSNSSELKQIHEKEDEDKKLREEQERTFRRSNKRLTEKVRSRLFDEATGELKAYQPDKKTDPSAGRKKWCGLCEREGHDSIDCPYENDIF